MIAYSEEAAADRAAEEECPHDERDHGVCLDCGKDCFDMDLDAMEYRKDD
jgi:hypothetical protein